MGRPKEGYRLADGARVPGVTTVIGRFKDAGGLMYWCWEQGRAGAAYMEAADKAAQAGTIAHDMVECDIKSVPFKRPEGVADEVYAKAENSFIAYLDWRKNVCLEIIETETPIVSASLRVGGTVDAIGRIGSQLVLVDWKTSNAVYADHLVQLAAYQYLWNEAHPARPVAGGFHLVRFAKEHGDFAHHFYPDLSEAREAFFLMRRLYDIDKELKKRAA